MNLIMSDCPLSFSLSFSSGQNTVIDLSALNISPCLGCFGCWVKTPGKCVIPDDAHKVYPLIAKSENVIYVTRLFHGSYSPIMKRMLERAIPIQQAFLHLYRGEVHHVPRNVVPKKAVIIAYGCDDVEEQELFRNLTERNALNMLFTECKVLFPSKEELEHMIESEVSRWTNS